jgi:hypothetical protein
MTFRQSNGKPISARNLNRQAFKRTLTRRLKERGKENFADLYKKLFFRPKR